jgi:Family of unknown function (DUF5696)
MDPNGRPAQRQYLKTSDSANDWFHTISTAAMTEHRFLTEKGDVEQTVFSNGYSIQVNFSAETWTKGQIQVPARSYRILSA